MNWRNVLPFYHPNCECLLRNEHHKQRTCTQNVNIISLQHEIQSVAQYLKLQPRIERKHLFRRRMYFEIFEPLTDCAIFSLLLVFVAAAAVVVRTISSEENKSNVESAKLKMDFYPLSACPTTLSPFFHILTYETIQLPLFLIRSQKREGAHDATMHQTNGTCHSMGTCSHFSSISSVHSVRGISYQRNGNHKTFQFCGAHSTRNKAHITYN